MQLHAVCYYRSKSDDWTDPWTDRHYLARNLVKGVKRSAFGGFSLLPLLNGKFRRLDNTPEGQKAALGYAAQFLLKLMKDAGYEGAHIVPVPSSSHVRPGAEFTGGRIAARIEKLDADFEARPVLHFDRPQPKSAAGGGRDCHEIQRHLRTSGLAGLENVVLLDDVMTSGAHLRAAARFLDARDVEVEDSFVVGRTIWAPKPSMFRVETEEIYV